MKTACAYYRTSSATNVGADKDSLNRQEDAVRKYATANGIEVVREYYDAAVSGADPVDTRPGFVDMIAYIKSNGARTILVETANRFARDLMVQEVGYRFLREERIELIAVDSPDSFVSDTPTAVMIRQILGSVAQFEKTMLVSKLRAARERTGRLGGNPNWVKRVPAQAAEMARVYRSQGMPLRAVALELAYNGLLSESGKPYGSEAIRRMLAQ